MMLLYEFDTLRKKRFALNIVMTMYNATTMAEIVNLHVVNHNTHLLK